MGSKASVEAKPIKYFMNFHSSSTFLRDRTTLKIKIQLSFFWIKCKANTLYKINNISIKQDNSTITLIDYESNDYEESIPDSNDNVNYKKSYIFDYYFEPKQIWEININDKTISIPIGRIVGHKDNTYTESFPIANNNEEITVSCIEYRNKNPYDWYFHFEMPMNWGIDYKKNNNKYYYKLYNHHKQLLLYHSQLLQHDGTIMDLSIPLNIILEHFSIEFYNASNKLIKEICYTPKTFITLKTIDWEVSRNESIKILNKSYLKENVTFLDYIKSGYQILTSFAIDFTQSNGDPEQPTSFHSFTKSPTYYEQAIQGCGDIISYYNYDNYFAVYGFGAVLKGETETNMCFNINEDSGKNIFGIHNILIQYKKCLKRITFGGPTHFAPILNKTISNIRSDNDKFKYYILLILTDGIVNDMQNTIDSIVEASSLPWSIVIVGIGNADFNNCIIWDGDKRNWVDRNGKKWKRNIVQFFRFDEYKDKPRELAKAVWEEIPSQFLEYYESNDIMPNK